jgi:hypothetical protein
MMWDHCFFGRVLCDTNNKISTAQALVQERALHANVGGRHAAEQKKAGIGCFLVPELVRL